LNFDVVLIVVSALQNCLIKTKMKINKGRLRFCPHSF